MKPGNHLVSCEPQDREMVPIPAGEILKDEKSMLTQTSSHVEEVLF